jgi:ribosomal protein S18 acetylase RimI-like enzyme
MVELELRPFQAQDQPVVRELIQAGLGEHFGFVDRTLNPDLDDIMASYIAAGHHFVVATIDDQIVGTGALVVQPGGVAELVRITVRPERRRQGIGRQVVLALIVHARRRSCTAIWVETNRDWSEAIRLYERCGFLLTARDSGSVYMELSLAQP